MSKANLEELFISSLGAGENLKWELDNNISLLNIVDKTILLAADVIFAFIPKRKKEELFEEIDTNSILDLLRKERSDLYSIIIQHPNGKIWVGRNIENFKKRFL